MRDDDEVYESGPRDGLIMAAVLLGGLLGWLILWVIPWNSKLGETMACVADPDGIVAAREQTREQWGECFRR